MVNFYNKKIAFSLFEALVVMGIIAVFISASTNVFTKRRSAAVQGNFHGRFECYYNSSGSLTQQYFIESGEQSATHPTGGECIFNPQRNAAYYVINVVGGGGSGNASSGGLAGQYQSFFLSHLDKELRISPGPGGNAGGNGTATVIKVVKDSVEKEIASVEGGNSSFNKSNLRAKDIKSCTVSSDYACGSEPSCSIHIGNAGNDDYIQFSYCKDDSLANENPEAYQVEILKISNFGNISSVFTNTSSGTTLSYDNPADSSKKKYRIRMDVFNNTTFDEDSSGLSNYISALGIDSGIKAASPGNGGAKGNDGKSGGVIILW